MSVVEDILKNNYTIFITKENNKFRGTCLQYFKDGIHPYHLPEEEMKILNTLPEIVKLLDSGSILQMNMPGSLIHTVIGDKKTEGPYCETEYLEVIDEVEKMNYYETLVDLNMHLACDSKKDLKGIKRLNKKLYRGVDKYE